MSTKTAITSSNFSKGWSSVCSAFGKVRDNVQLYLSYALDQYRKGNFTHINEIINSGKMLKGLSMNSLKVFILGHCDVKLVKLDDGSYKFESLKTRNFKYVEPTKTWYEYSNVDAITIVEPLSMLGSVIKRIEGALSSEGNTSVAKKDVKGGKEILAKLKVVQAAA